MGKTSTRAPRRAPEPTADRPTEPERTPEWIGRDEVRAELGVSEADLRRLTSRHQLSKRWVPLYYKPEVLALRELAKAIG